MERAAEATMGGGQSWKAYDIIMKWMGSRWRRRRKKPRRRRRGHNKNCFREWWDFYEQEMRLFIGRKKTCQKIKKILTLLLMLKLSDSFFEVCSCNTAENCTKRVCWSSSWSSAEVICHFHLFIWCVLVVLLTQSLGRLVRTRNLALSHLYTQDDL